MQRRGFAALSVAAFAGALFPLRAQEPKKLTLEELLKQLQVNLDHFDKSVPSFFCDEHVVSLREGERSERMEITDSVFRLKRNERGDGTAGLEESRDIKSVNGKPPAKQDLEGPSVLRGAFEGGLAVVSADQKDCMRYELQRTKGSRPNDPYTIRFSTDLTDANVDSCLLSEPSKGKVMVDPASMQIVRVEITTPKHTIVPADAFDPAIVGIRQLTIGYGPVMLEGQTFWMPSTITMHAVSGDGTFHRMSWAFQATYRNYHKLEVKSRILPGGGLPVP